MKKLLFLALFATLFITFDLKAQTAETAQTENKTEEAKTKDEAKLAAPKPKKPKKYANVKCKTGGCLRLKGKGKGKATPYVRSKAKTVN